MDTLGESKILDLLQALKALGEAEGRTQETRVGRRTLSISLVGGREQRFAETMRTLGSAGAMPQTA